MNYEKYTEKLLKQYDLAVNAYARLIFQPVDHLSRVQAYRTREHLRLPPGEGYSPLAQGETWGGEWENIWLSFDVSLPDHYKGKQIWLIPHIGATEILGFRNGVPCGIINSKNDFIGGNHAALFVGKCDGSASWHMDQIGRAHV